MIQIDDFMVASFEKKCELIVSHTSYITSRQVDERKVYLYHTGKFFIEVLYSPQLKRVLVIQPFNDLDNLMPYAESVSLADLKL